MSKKETAARFIEQLALPPRSGGWESNEADLDFDFDAAKKQALVVGSDVVSFVDGVTAERRQDIVQSALLAQLAANKAVPDRTNIFQWYEAYLKVLMNIGWVAQEINLAEFDEKLENFEAHRAVLKMAAGLLGEATAAYTVVKAALDALLSESDKPWITLFNREAKTAQAARFQVMLVDHNEGGKFMVSMMAFGFVAKADFVRVLLFKFQSGSANIKQYSGKVTIDADVLASVRDKIKAKLTGHATDFVAQLPNL